MKTVKRIEMKNLDLQLNQDDTYFYVFVGENKAMTSKNLKSAMDYFDIIFNEYLKLNN